MSLNTRDATAALVAILLVLGVIALALQGKEVPPELAGALGVAAGYLFRGTSDQYLASRGKRP